MKKSTLNSKIYVTVDRLSAVFCSLCTAVFVSLAIYIVMLGKMGDDRTLAVLCRLFPSRELVSVLVLLLSLSVSGVVAMICYNFDMLSWILTADSVLKILATVFLLIFTKISVLYIPLALCIVYFLSSLLRTLCEPLEILQDDDEF